MRKYILLVSTILLLSPVAAFAYGKRQTVKTSPMARTATTATFLNRQIWLPSTWTVTEGTGTLTFEKKAPDAIHKSIVKLVLMPRELCGYGYIRIRALKAWGGASLDQAQGRLQPISYGTSKFKGYTWV